MDPIFMIGIQRSGSNLLRLMLNQLPEIAAPHPPHVLLMPLHDLADGGGRNRLGGFPVEIRIQLKRGRGHLFHVLALIPVLGYFERLVAAFVPPGLHG